MPIVDDNAATDQAAESARRRRERQERQSGGDVRIPSTAAPALSERKMLNLAESRRIGTLDLFFVCPPVREALALEAKIFQAWPDVFVFAVLGDRVGPGIDTDATVAFWNLSRMAAVTGGNGSAASVAGDGDRNAVAAAESVTPAFLRAQATAVLREMPAQIGPIADTVWPLVKETPGITWPRVEGDAPTGLRYLDDALLDSLRLPEFADLLRAVLDTLGGFPGDAGDRF